MLAVLKSLCQADTRLMGDAILIIRHPITYNVIGYQSCCRLRHGIQMANQQPTYKTAFTLRSHDLRHLHRQFIDLWQAPRAFLEYFQLFHHVY